jgi:hypothetical protein
LQAIGEIADSLAGPAAESDDAAEGQDEAAAAAAPVGLVSVPRKVVKSKELLDYLERPEVIVGTADAADADSVLHCICSSACLCPVMQRALRDTCTSGCRIMPQEEA